MALIGDTEAVNPHKQHWQSVWKYFPMKRLLNDYTSNKTRFIETQIVSILKQQEAGRSIKELAREHGISGATFYNWKG